MENKNRFKHKDGSFIGKNNIFLVRRTYKTKPRKWKGIFICPQCGKEFETYIGDIIEGKTKKCKSCNHLDKIAQGYTVGKLSKNGVDYTKRYNPFYDFIEKTNEQDKDGNYYWKVKCRFCDRVYEVIPSQLVSEKRTSGNNPCCCQKNESTNVILIKELLRKMNINFKQEYKFNNCLSPKGNKMKFDFYLPDYNCCIEYDGEQHFRPVNFGIGKEKSIEKYNLQKQYDKIKDNYCEENGIKLIRIPYSQTITEQYLSERICENDNL